MQLLYCRNCTLRRGWKPGSRPSRAVTGRKPPIGCCRLHRQRWNMRQTEPVIEDSGVAEDLHQLWLMALLHEPVCEKDNRALLRRWLLRVLTSGRWGK